MLALATSRVRIKDQIWIQLSGQDLLLPHPVFASCVRGKRFLQESSATSEWMTTSNEDWCTKEFSSFLQFQSGVAQDSFVLCVFVSGSFAWRRLRILVCIVFLFQFSLGSVFLVFILVWYLYCISLSILLGLCISSFNLYSGLVSAWCFCL